MLENLFMALSIDNHILILVVLAELNVSGLLCSCCVSELRCVRFLAPVLRLEVVAICAILDFRGVGGAAAGVIASHLVDTPSRAASGGLDGQRACRNRDVAAFLNEFHLL